MFARRNLHSPHQNTLDFEGSDAWSNWKSDLGNSGASEIAKIGAQAQAALEQLKGDERYTEHNFAANGHSLGGGLVQIFALKNNLDAYVCDSLPIARGTIQGACYEGVGGIEATLEHCLVHCRASGGARGAPEQFLVSLDGQKLGVLHQGQVLSEMPIEPALEKTAETHLAKAAQVAQNASSARESVALSARETSRPTLARGWAAEGASAARAPEPALRAKAFPWRSMAHRGRWAKALRWP